MLPSLAPSTSNCLDRDAFCVLFAGAPTLPPSDLQPPKLTAHISDGPLAVKVRDLTWAIMTGNI
ncbi:hypothetical protein B0H10DRAFT_1976049 [Mycena sp. CBHHK59/15]|nr:hypothetical protein B0H10DRAFT_1976049 [Mycena sp. CBHHK59/15]